MNGVLKWKLAFAFLLVFVAGVTTGGLLSSMHARRHFLGPPHSGDVAGRMREHFRRALDLTAEEETKIAPIIGATAAKLEAIRVETAERVRTVMEESKREVAPYLSSEQQKKLEKLESEHRKLMIHHRFPPPPKDEPSPP
jgi:Spy/CpxP family protein refolding chaperone